ncbi:hypothetical protein [Silicimonas sp. MF1-12-2]|uniref:hypothetical protein n=1 Tax=Silicimonas sp. MF1-12-2 TaxID=3384793 RepID=UPI0039B4C347
MTRPRVTELHPRPQVWMGIALGALLYAALQWIAWAWSETPFIGGFIYNYYFLGLLDGSLTVPAQIAGLEGFYDAEGRAFLYHGVGPLFTRLLAWPFVDLTVVDLRVPTIWLFATLGSAGFYATGVSVIRWLKLETPVPGLGALLWLLIWVLAPGFVLASNGSFFHEPLAFAFAMAGLGLYCTWRLVEGGFEGWPWLLGVAVAGAFAVHGRPHVAVGLYLVVVLASLVMLWRVRGRALVPVGAAMAVLLVSGLAYLQLNALRFGSATATSGTVSDAAARTVYGFLYWGWEPPDNPRFQSQKTHGSFYPGRILPNLFLYAFSMGGEASVGFYRRISEHMGHVRIEPPVLGFVLLWLPWCILAVTAAFRRGGTGAFLWLGLAANLPAALVMLSYTTYTMRYRTELWPVFFVLGVVALAGLLERMRNYPEARKRMMRSMWIASVAALGVGLLNVYVYRDMLNWDWGTALRSYEDCARMVTEHPGLGVGKVREICVLDVPGS